MLDDELVEVDAQRMKVARTFRVTKGLEKGFDGLAPRGDGSDPSVENHGSMDHDRMDHAAMNMTASGNACMPTWAQPSVDGKRVWVACNKSNEIVEVDASKWELMRRIPAGNGVYNLGVSPDGKWVATQDSRSWGALFVFPAGSASSTLICGNCSPPRGPDPIPPYMSWTPDGKFLYLKFASSTYAIPLRPGKVLPPIPASGFQSREAVAALPGARLVSEQESVYPGPNPSIYAFAKVATQRNIYRVPVP